MSGEDCGKEHHCAEKPENSTIFSPTSQFIHSSHAGKRGTTLTNTCIPLWMPMHTHACRLDLSSQGLRTAAIAKCLIWWLLLHIAGLQTPQLRQLNVHTIVPWLLQQWWQYSRVNMTMVWRVRRTIKLCFLDMIILKESVALTEVRKRFHPFRTQRWPKMMEKRHLAPADHHGYLGWTDKALAISQNVSTALESDRWKTSEIGHSRKWVDMAKFWCRNMSTSTYNPTNVWANVCFFVRANQLLVQS